MGRFFHLHLLSSAFGESPDRNHDWYNFRLDRIQNITPIKWTNSAIPKVLQQRYQKADLPRPEEIEAQMSKAWGFDFYLEPRLMLLRFEPEYHERYAIFGIHFFMIPLKRSPTHK
jgi:CRISPR-associated protein (TIGR03985 family)